VWWESEAARYEQQTCHDRNFAACGIAIGTRYELSASGEEHEAVSGGQREVASGKDNMWKSVPQGVTGPHVWCAESAQLTDAGSITVSSETVARSGETIPLPVRMLRQVEEGAK
jgi:hypothetical protein